jgi:GTPase SAR1 family protein
MYEVDHCSYLYGELHALVGQWFRDTDCYALVYSATSMASFNHIRDWKNMLDAVPTSCPGPICDIIKPGSRILVALIETKCDLTEEREVRAYDGVQLARELGCSFFQTSARTGHNVDTVFETMGKAFRDANRPIS